MESIFKLGILLSVVDSATGPASKIGKGMDQLKGKVASLGPVFDKFKTYGLRVATFGALMLHILSGTVMATVDTQKALGELSSVGIVDLGALEKAGAQFSSQWSGTTKAQFISAAYDIKSGISTLTDTGVAEFTKLAALTGKATKATTAEMTSLFATGYGIYKDMYADLSDMQFGEIFSAGIAASVKSFKTTGSGMAQAISTLGAVATTAKVPMEEQLTILGMLQATMTGSEAGTKYKALMQAAAGAGTKLKLEFTDVNNQLLSMPEILMKLKGKYGETLDAVEKMEIQKAFGTQEAVAVIDLLYGKVGALTENTRSLSAAMRQGTGFTEQMAQAMNQDIGSGIALLEQRWHNLVEVVGKQLVPVLLPVFAWIGSGINRIAEFAEKHAVLTRVFVVGLGVISALAFGLGTLAAVVGTAGLVWPVMAAGLVSVTAAAWGFTAALLANPVAWIVVGIGALIAVLAVLWRNLEGVINFLEGVFSSIGSWWADVGSGLKGGILGALNWILGLGPRFLEAGGKLWDALAAGIKARLLAPVELVKRGLLKLRNLLPFSDAKEGPLSALTLSGQRIMETLGAGMQNAAPGLKSAAAGALSGLAAAALMTVPISPAVPSLSDLNAQAVWETQAIKAPKMPDLSGKTTWRSVDATGEKPALKDGKKAYRGGRDLKIQTLNVTLPNVTDAESFVAQLRNLVEGYDA